MKKIIIFSLLTIILLSNKNVQAQSNYTNKNGVVFTPEEYNFISEMYWDGYQELMTKQDFKEIKDSDVMNGEIEVKEVKLYDDILTRGTQIIDASRNLKIFKSCSSNCLISVTLNWLNNPTVRSYDVIGAYITNTSFVNSPTTMVSSNSSAITISDLTKTSNGIRSSFKLPSGSNITINQTFRVNKGGHVYASYQHAKSTSTLSKSKNYTFSNLGYGRVFNFNGSSRNIYDAMNGVDISV